MNEPKRIAIGKWAATPSLNLLERNGETLRIEPRAMDVLVALAARPGEVVSTRELLASVWKGVVVGDGSVYLAINQLRSALDRSGDEPSHIETVPKRGYRLTVRAGPVAPKSALPASAAAAPLTAARARRIPLVGALLTAALLCAALAFALWQANLGAPRPSVAVLPFDDLSAARDQEYLADGLTEQLLNVLSRIGDLHVAGRTSSFYFKGRSEDPRTMGRSLGVEYLLDGSVQRTDDRLRVSAQLIDAGTGYEVWSETYEQAFGDVFSVQDRIAASVAAALQITLGVGELPRIPGMTRNAEAYDEYLRGLFFNIEARPESIPAAFHHLERAVALDPSFSVGWAALHTVYDNGTRLVPQRAADWRRKGEEALARAQALTPDAPEVVFEMGMAALRRGDWRLAGDHFASLEDAHARHGTPDRAHGPRGAFLLAVGRVREAIEALERAKTVEPLEVAYAYFLAEAYLAVGRLDAARAEIERGWRLHGLEPALAELELALAFTTGDEAEIDRRARAFLAGGADEDASFVTAQWAAAHGEPERAVELLALAAPNLGHPGLFWRPYMSDVRRRSEFVELVRDFGLVEYWRRHGWPDYCRPVGAEGLACD